MTQSFNPRGHWYEKSVSHLMPIKFTAFMSQSYAQLVKSIQELNPMDHDYTVPVWLSLI